MLIVLNFPLEKVIISKIVFFKCFELWILGNRGLKIILPLIEKLGFLRSGSNQSSEHKYVGRFQTKEIFTILLDRQLRITTPGK